jgi:hypothetical protein
VRYFGGVEQLKARFAEAGQERFGSGWVWLARTQLAGGRLQVLSTFGHENPMLQGHYPILVNDVWEHAYYLKYENRRADYLESWWAVANWEEAARRYEVPIFWPGPETEGGGFGDSMIQTDRPVGCGNPHAIRTASAGRAGYRTPDPSVPEDASEPKWQMYTRIVRMLSWFTVAENSLSLEAKV